MARTRKPVALSEKQIQDLARIGCTDREIAVVAEVSEDTISRNYAEILAKGREQGKSRLRRLQWKAAEKGNVTMQIWLGKQLLGQSDKAESINSVKIIDHGNLPLSAEFIKPRATDRPN